MPPHHVIRLRGPWHFQALPSAQAADSAEPPARKAQLPCPRAEVLGDGFTGKLLGRRSFNRPTNLAPDERVRLVIEPAGALAGVQLNNHDLSGELPTERGQVGLEIAPLLELHNELRLEFELTAAVADEPLVGEVWLEFHAG